MATEIVPRHVRIRFAHASAQSVADRAGVDVLHIKGASLDPNLNPGRAESSDADVLVRPSHVTQFMEALPAAGWNLWCDFEEGSLFEHAASLHHQWYGMLDVHQNFPGLHRDPAGAFDLLWRSRTERLIGGAPCAAPGPTHEHLIMLLHAARSPGKDLDILNHWQRLEPQEQAVIRDEAEALGATVGLDVALGLVDETASPEVELWLLSLDNSDRLQEWRARWRNTSGLHDRAALAARALRVNRFALGQRLGHPPSSSEIRKEWWRRAGAGLLAAARMLPGIR